MSYLDIPRWALAIDWETSGFRAPQKKADSYAQEHQGISFGAKIVDLRTYFIVDEMYLEIKFNDKYKWEAGAERVHGITREHLEANGLSQEEAAVKLANMLVKYFGISEVIMIGHRVYFDKDFTDQLFDVIDIKIPWHPTLIDVSAICTALIEMSNSEQIFQALGMPARKAHNADEDISMTLDVLRQMKRFMMKGLMTTYHETNTDNPVDFPRGFSDMELEEPH